MGNIRPGRISDELVWGFLLHIHVTESEPCTSLKYQPFLQNRPRKSLLGWSDHWRRKMSKQQCRGAWVTNASAYTQFGSQRHLAKLCFCFLVCKHCVGDEQEHSFCSLTDMNTASFQNHGTGWAHERRFTAQWVPNSVPRITGIKLHVALRVSCVSCTMLQAPFHTYNLLNVSQLQCTRITTFKKDKTEELWSINLYVV